MAHLTCFASLCFIPTSFSVAVATNCHTLQTYDLFLWPVSIRFVVSGDSRPCCQNEGLKKKSSPLISILSWRYCSSCWFSIPPAAGRGWRDPNHLKNAPSVTSELLVEKHEANLSRNICRVDWPSHILVGTMGFVINKTASGAESGGVGGGAHLHLYIFMGRSRQCVHALICILMGNKQPLNQLLAFCVIFKDERTLKTMKPLPWGFCRKGEKQLERRMRPLIWAVRTSEWVWDCTQK